MISVLVLLVAFVVIAYIIGLTYWLSTNKGVTLVAVLIGHWLLVNVVYHYYKALTVSPGHPPQVCFSICLFEKQNYLFPILGHDFITSGIILQEVYVSETAANPSLLGLQSVY